MTHFSFGDDILQADYCEYGDEEKEEAAVEFICQPEPTAVILLSYVSNKKLNSVAFDYELEDFREFSVIWRKLVNTAPLKPFDDERVYGLASDCTVYLGTCPWDIFKAYAARFLSILNNCINLCQDANVMRFRYAGFKLFKTRRKIKWDDPLVEAQTFVAACQKFFDAAEAVYSNRVEGLQIQIERLKLGSDPLRKPTNSQNSEIPTSFTTPQSSSINNATCSSQPLKLNNDFQSRDPRLANPIKMNNAACRNEMDRRTSAPVASLKHCSKCLASLPKSDFSLNQWKKAQFRLCKLCLSADTSKLSRLLADLPPLPSLPPLPGIPPSPLTPILIPSSSPMNRSQIANKASSFPAQIESKAEVVLPKMSSV